MTTVERLRVDAVQISQASPEGRLRRLNEQVVVVSHQDIGVDPPAERLDHATQSRQEALPILVVAKDLFNFPCRPNTWRPT